MSHLAAIMRAQGSLPPPKPGTFIPPELRSHYASLYDAPGSASSGADFASFEASFPDDAVGRFPPIAQPPETTFAAPIVTSPPVLPTHAPPQPPAPPIPPGQPPAQLNYNPATMAVAVAPPLAIGGGAALGLGATLGAGAAGLTAAGAIYWYSRTPEQQQAITAHVRDMLARAGQAGTDGFVPPVTTASSILPPPNSNAPPAPTQQTASPFVDAAPNLPPLPGFTPPAIVPWQESFPSNSGYTPENEGFSVLSDVKQFGLEGFPDESGLMHHWMIVENRKGNEATRKFNELVREWFLSANPGAEHVGGGRDRKTGEEKKEYWFAGPGKEFGDTPTGGRYADLTFKMPNGSFVHVQTVDTDKNGAPTNREWNAARWLKAMTGSDVYLIPKPKRQRPSE